MLGNIAIISSGLTLDQQRLEASAHNTANLNTRPSAVLRSEAREGVQGGVEGGMVAGEGPADPVVESVEQITLSHQATALKKTLQTQSDMVGQLLALEA
ncbi:MAG: flagellar basal body rod protein [Candidatus Latescibacteria bacterium]|nr:flagellar basal body rod protein [Candidatus Latescibacterota bacterium]